MIFILWLLVWLFSIVHPFLNGIYLITFLEYEHNHISSISLCKNLNIMIKVEYITHLVLMAVLAFFISNTWLALLFNAPIIGYHAWRFYERTYELDPTELYQQVKQRKKESIIKIGYYVFLFGFYLFSFIKSVIDFESR